MRFVALASLLLIVLLGVLLLVMPLSEAGTRWLSALAHRFTPLEIEHRSGSLISGPVFSRLSYSSANVLVELSDVTIQPDLGCLWRSTLCFSSVDVGELNIELAGGRGDEDRNEETTEVPVSGVEAGDGKTDAVELTARISFPVSVESAELDIAAVRVSWPGGEWRQASAELRTINVRDSEIAIESAILSSTEFALQETKDEQAVLPARIELPVIRLPFKLSLGALSLRAPRWDVYGSILEHKSLAMGGAWDGARLTLDKFEVRSREFGSLAATGGVEFDQEWPLQLAGQIHLNRELAVAGLPEGPVQMELSGSVSTFVARLFHAGRREVSVEFNSDLLDRLLPFTLDVQASGDEAVALSEFIDLPQELAGFVIEPPMRVDVSGTRDRQRFELLGGFAGLGYETGIVSASGERAGADIVLDSVVLLDEHSNSKLEASGEIEISEEMVLSLELLTPGIKLPEFASAPVGRIWGELAFQARLGGGGWQLGLTDMRLEGQVDGRDASAEGDFYLNQDWLLGDSDLQVKLNGADLSLIAAGDGSREGRLNLFVEDIGRWQDEGRGQIDLQGTINPGLQLLQFEGAVDKFAWGALQVDSGELAGNVDLGGVEFDISLRAQSLAVADLTLSHLALSVSGDQHKQLANLASEGDIRGDLQLSGSGWGEGWTGALAPVALETPHGIWQLNKGVAMTWSPGLTQLAVDAHCWQRENASACFEKLELGSTGSLVLSASGDMEMLESLLPVGLQVSGTTELALQGSWSPTEAPLFSGSWSTRSASFIRNYGEGESARVNWDRGDGSLRFDGRQLALQWAIHREGRNILGFDAQIPVAPDEPVAGVISVSQLQLEPLIAFLPSLAELRGSLTGRLALSGTRARPEATGLVRLSDGRIVLAGNPTAVEEIDLALDLRGDQAALKGSGMVGGGPVQLDGELLLQPQWALQLKIDGARQRVLYPPATELLLSEQLTLKASNGLVEVSGDIVVHEGRLEPEELPEGSVAVSPHVVEVDYQGNVIRETLPFDLSLDVDVTVENQFKVRTSLLFATIGGELNILQRPRRPLQLFGTLRVVDGHVSAYQQKLQIQRGIFSFTGRPDNPGVNVRAVRKISGSNVVVGMQVLGTYEALNMDVFSEPRMSDGEAMSYLVRGRGLDTSAGEDGTALALSVASGVVNRSTLVEELNGIPGVSNVSFGSDGANEDTAATVSGFIGERIFLSYGVGVYEPINVLIARLYLRTRLWLEVVSRLENSVDLYYAFDID